jgi:DNA polymerase III alpha subunit
MPKIEVQEEEQNLWSWNELEHLSKFDTLLVLGGIHCMIGKTLLAAGPELAEKVLLRTKELFGPRLSLALICEPWNKKYATVIKVDYTDQSYDSLLASDTVSTDRARKIKASELISRGGHKFIESKVVGSTYFSVGKEIAKVTEHKGFLPLSVDATLEINKFFLEMSKKHEIQLLVSDYAFYAEKEDHIVQTVVLENKTKIKSDLHMKSEEEFDRYLSSQMDLSALDRTAIIESTNNWAKNFDNFELKYEWRLADTGSVPALQQCMEIIKKNGRMKWENPEYVQRLREEIEVIAYNPKKDLSGYFLPIVEVLDFYKKNGYLTSIGRGSAGGSLFCYLLEITHIDPIEWNLPFSRFFSLDRIMNNKLPDIDVDLPTRTPLISKDGKSGFLLERWGNKACQVSSRATVRLKSAIKDTNRYFNNGSVEKDIEIVTKSLPQPPQGVPDHDFVFGYEDTDENHIPGLIEQSDVLQKYSINRPKEWEVVKRSMGLTRAFSVHPCAILLSDVPISDIIPTKNGTICQYEHKQAEEAGLIKFDFLTVNQLLDIQECIKLINKKNGDPISPSHFTHNGKKEFIWKLPQISEVYKSTWNGENKTLFQIHTPGMSNFTKELLPEKMMDIASTLALERPGPLDFKNEVTGRSMTEEYLYRRQGKSEPDIKELAELLPDTYGIICYQEDLNKIARNIANMDGETAEKLRENMAKKKLSELIKMKPQFIEGTSKKIIMEIAETIWNQMVTFGRYGFSIIHAAEYAHITYATMFLRHFYPLEWYCSILTNASEKEISGNLWGTVKDYLAPPDINLSSDEMEIDYANQKIRSKLGVIRGMGDASIDPIVNGRPYHDIQDFVNRGVAGPSLSRKLIHVGVLDSLFPPKSNLMQKLQLFENAVEVNKYNQKVENNKKEGRVTRQQVPDKGQIPEEYLHIEEDPMKNAAIKKSILPSLLVGLYDLGRHQSKCIIGREKPSRIVNSPSTGKEVLLISGEMLQRLDEMPAEAVMDDKYVAVTAFVVSTSIFDYKKNTKQALKVTIDVDGVVGEKVLWPDYFSSELVYPKELKKGNICTVFLKKRANKGDICSITEIVIEA